METKKSLFDPGMDRIRALLNEGRALEALNLINHVGQTSAQWQNARGVCLLRLGRTDEAVTVLRDVVFPDNCIFVPDDVPALYRANFATAMILVRNIEAAYHILEYMDVRGHPYAQQLATAFQRWNKTLSWIQRLLGSLGWYPDKSICLDFPPGAV